MNARLRDSAGGLPQRNRRQTVLDKQQAHETFNSTDNCPKRYDDQEYTAAHICGYRIPQANVVEAIILRYGNARTLHIYIHCIRTACALLFQRS